MTTAVPASVSLARLLVPTDFTDTSEKALDYARAIGRRHHSEIILAHVFAPLNPIIPPEAGWIEEESAVERLNSQLEEKGDALREEGLLARAVSLTGSVQQELLDYCVREKVDLMVLGSHFKPIWERLMVGSDAEALYRQAHLPVLVVGPACIPIGILPWQPANVLCATDLNPESLSIAAAAWAFAEQYRAAFTLLHLTHPALEDREAKLRRFEEDLHRMLPEIPATAHQIRNPAFADDMGPAIVASAREHKCDLILMGAHSASFLKTHFLHGISSRVIDEATCPVLILH